MRTITIPQDAKLDNTNHTAARLVERYSVHGVDMMDQRPGQRNYNIGVNPLWEDGERLTENELCQELTKVEIAEARRVLMAIIAKAGPLEVHNKSEHARKQQMYKRCEAEGKSYYIDAPQYMINSEMIIAYCERTNTIKSVMRPEEARY